MTLTNPPPLKRDFYIEICRLERWSVRQLQERINSLLFERTAISKKPEDTIRQDLKQLREQGQLSPDLINEVGYWLNPPLPLSGEGRDGGLPSEVPVVRIDPRYLRPTEVETLLGDPTKAKEKLGWVPEITLQEMVQEMVASDLAYAKQHALLKLHGYQIAVSVE